MFQTMLEEVSTMLSHHTCAVAIRMCASCALGVLVLARSAIAAPERPVHEDWMACNVYDHEILDNVIAWQENSVAEDPESEGNLVVARLRGTPRPPPPYDPDDIFLSGPTAIDSHLAPLGESTNGPEIGYDKDVGYEVAYTKVNTSTGKWYIARAANNFTGSGWNLRSFPNQSIYDNRWSPFVTLNSELDPPEAAKVVYAAGDPTNAQSRVKAFRELEDWDGQPWETVISGGANANGYGRWVRLDNKDYILSTLPDSQSGDVDTVLYDVSVPNPAPINLTGDRDGVHSAGWIDWDAAAGLNGQYALVTARFETTNENTKTYIEVFERVDVNPDVWEFQYEFDAHDADSLLSEDWSATSPELFHYGDPGHLYISFVAASAADPFGASVGNIMITRVEAGDATPANNHYRILNVCDGDIEGFDPCEHSVPTRKRTEPEIHYLTSGRPVVFYTLAADADDCPNDGVEGVNMLMRASTGDLWNN